MKKITNIETILDSINIVDVIASFIDLKTRGHNKIAHCPFHSEKTESFTINESKQFYHCFGCGKSGGAINFIMEHEKLNYRDTILWLAKFAKIVPEFEHSDDPEFENNEKLKSSLYIIYKEAMNFYCKNLNINPEALQYVESRKLLTEDNIYKIGLSLNEWDSLYNNLIKKGFNEEILSQSGLFFTSKINKQCDLFRDRIMFPIFDKYNNVIAFGGRIYKNDDINAKYINSPNTLIYNKSYTFYGLGFALNSIFLKDFVIINEGYTDVIAMQLHNHENTVGTCGTSLTNEHIKNLKKYTKHFVLLFDGDLAGKQAMEKAGMLCIKNGIQTDICILNNNLDPAQYYTHGINN